jgi:hypothetical protein
LTTARQGEDDETGEHQEQEVEQLFLVRRDLVNLLAVRR